MAIAGKTAPDIGESWFHIIGSEVRNGFLYPLNEWIGEDSDGNGIIDDDETIWEPWKKVPPLWRRVAMNEGKVYGIPQAVNYQMGVIFRIQHRQLRDPLLASQFNIFMLLLAGVERFF